MITAKIIISAILVFFIIALFICFWKNTDKEEKFVLFIISFLFLLGAACIWFI